jgi:minor extracellular serine protease Vpr
MKVFFVLVTIIGFFSTTLIGQVRIPSNTRADVEVLIKDLKRNGNQFSSLIKNRFAIYQIQGITYVSFLGKVNAQFNPTSLKNKGIIVGNQRGSILSLKVPIDQLDQLDALTELASIQLSGKIKPLLDKAVHDVGADSVQLGIGLPQGYTGKNVLIGITDWGFDYSSPMFYDTLLQNNRILAAWDQYKVSGPPPTGFNYGTEYSTLPEYIAVGSDTANIYSYATHGSHVAGIAGGGGGGTAYRGVAFDAQFLFATFLVDEGSVLDAWEWMYQKSLQESKRLVINMSWGLYHLGTLDGTSLLSQAIDAYSELGVIFSNSGGNNGNVNFHLKKNFAQDEMRTRIEFYSYASNPNMWGQSIHGWGEPGNSFEAGLQVFNSFGSSLLAESPYYNTATTSTYIDTFLVTGIDTIWYNISADAAHPQNGRPQLRLRVKNTNTNLRVVFKARADNGLVHFWNVTELSNDVGNWGMPFSVFGSGTVAGDNQYGISEPSCTNSLLSVAAYSSKYLAANGSSVGGGIASFSSIGPRYDEVLKPEIAAPGVSVASSISSYTDAAFTAVASVPFNGRTYPFARFSGTSMSAPMVTGVIALILEANPYLSAEQVKSIIIQTAREDNNTGVIPLTGSTQWGWGKLNARLAVELALNTVGTVSLQHEITWNIYPNPVQSYLRFTIIDELPKRAQLIDSMGKIIHRAIQDGSVYVGDLPAGNYRVRIQVKGRIEQQAFVKQ